MRNLFLLMASAACVAAAADSVPAGFGEQRTKQLWVTYRSFNKELETVSRFYEAGIRQFCVFPSNTTNSLGQNYSEYPFNWYFFNEYEFEHVDQQIQDIIDIAPDAEILFMIDLNTPH